MRWNQSTRKSENCGNLLVTVKRDSDGIFSLSATGHALYAARGEDIVCAAVSTLMQTLIVGLEDVLELDGVEIVKDAALPLISVSWRDRSSESRAIADTIMRSLQAVAGTYPDYVTIVEEET